MSLSKSDVSNWMRNVESELSGNDRPVIRSGINDEEESEMLEVMFAFESEMPLAESGYVMMETQLLVGSEPFGFDVAFRENETVGEAIGAESLTVVEVTLYPLDRSDSF